MLRSTGNPADSSTYPNADESALRWRTTLNEVDLTRPAQRPLHQSMLHHGLLNPQLLSLLARIRHTNTLVIADSMFPSWPSLETVDLALVYGIPTLPQVVEAILAQWHCGTVRMAEEFKANNSAEVRAEFERAFGAVPIDYEPHLVLKGRVPAAIGLIRTGERRLYTNIILESA